MLGRVTCAALIVAGLLVSLSTGLVLGLAATERDPPPVALFATAY
jgi:hypothetical protein